MAERKLDIISAKFSNRSLTVKGSMGNDEDNVLADMLDDSNDPSVPENTIPLSPQWLYAKPNELKMETRGANTLTLGHPVDLNQKDAWRPDASEEKKDWIRIAPEPDSGGHWREEERETGLLGRRVVGRWKDVLTMHLAEKFLTTELCLPLTGGMMLAVAILGMRQGMMANGLQDGVLMSGGPATGWREFLVGLFLIVLHQDLDLKGDEWSAQLLVLQ